MPELQATDLEGWEEAFAAEGIEDIEALLDKHARFADYLEARGEA